MPNQNQSDPNQNTPQVASGQPTDFVPPVISPQSDLPPLPPAFQDLPESNVNTTTTASDQPPHPVVVETSGSSAPPKPKKKFGGGKIIATILGLIVLVGGVGAGIVLTQQKQLFQQKAMQCDCSSTDECGSGYRCTGGTCGKCVLIPTPEPTAKQTTKPKSGKCCPRYDTNGSKNTCTGAGESACKINSSQCTWADDGSCPSTTNPNPTTNPTPTGSSSCDGGCANGYNCVGTYCQANTDTSCGRDTDPNAPVCCTTSCAKSDTVCEAPFRKECKTTAGNGTKWCLIGHDSKYCNVPGTPTPTSPPGKSKSTPTPTPTSTLTPMPTSIIISTPTPTPVHMIISTPTPTSTAPYCAAIYVYDTNWNPIYRGDVNNLSKLTPGDKIRFAVIGSSNGSIDKAKFDIVAKVGEVNQGTVSGDVTNKKSGSNEFYFEYTIPEGATSIKVSAKVHDATSGNWF